MTEHVQTWKILAVILVVGVGLYIGLSSSAEVDTFTVNGFAFSETLCPDNEETCYETTVVTNIGVHPITFYHDPREIQDIPVDPQAVTALLDLTRNASTSITIAFDEGVPGEVGVAATLLARVTGDRLYGISTRGAVYGQDVSCAQSTRVNRVVYLTQQAQNGVYMNEECIIIAAQDTTQLIDVVDAYTMRALFILV